MAEIAGFDGRAIILPSGLEFNHGDYGHMAICIHEEHSKTSLLGEHLARLYATGQGQSVRGFVYYRDMLTYKK